MVRMLPQYSTVTFSEVWDDVEGFLENYGNCGIPTTITTQNATTLFYLLFGRFGNNPIANRDINQFKYKIFSVIFEYGPTWEKKLAIQTSLRGLTDAQLREGAEAVYNHAYNSSTTPATNAYDPLNYINEQNASKHKKGPLDGYAILIALLEDDITYRFLNKFQHCFKQFVAPEDPLLYVTEEDED